MKMATRFSLVAVLAIYGGFISSQGQVHAGPIIVGGDDTPDHGQFNPGTGENEDGWLYVQRAVENILAQVTRRNDGTIAALGSAPEVDPAVPPVLGSDPDGQAGAAIFFAAFKQDPPVNVRYFEGAAAIQQFFTDLGNGNERPAMIWFPGNESGNDLDNAEAQALTDNAQAINNFLATGGGVFAHGTGSDPDEAFGWLAALLPGLVEINNCNEVGATLTPEGQAAFPGMTDDTINENAGPCHSSFDATSDFGGLEILAIGGDLVPFIIGGVVGGITALQIAGEGPENVAPGGQIVFNLNFQNSGTNNILNVIIRAQVPQGTLFSSAENGGALQNDVVVFNVGQVNAGAQGTVSFTVTHDVAVGLNEVHLDNYTIEGTGFLPLQGPMVNVEVGGENVADVGISIDAEDQQQGQTNSAGDQRSITRSQNGGEEAPTLTFTVTVTNAGPDPAADAVLTTTFSANVDIVSSELIEDEPDTAQTRRAQTRQNETTVSIINLGTIGVGEERVVVMLIRILSAGDVSARATVNGNFTDPNQANNLNVAFQLNRPELDGGGGGCFIATASFGSSLEVKSLSAFRDSILLTSRVGQEFTQTYYSNSPVVADYIRSQHTTRVLLRRFLRPTVNAAGE